MTVVAGRVGVITDPPLQESISDPQTLLDALEEPVAEPLTLNPTDSDASLFIKMCCSFLLFFMNVLYIN